MLVASLQHFFNSSPAIHLLRSPNAPWILDFLDQQFKRSGQITRIHSTLAIELELYLDHLDRQWESTQWESNQNDERRDSGGKRDRAETYLSSWCSATTGWLKRFIDGDPSEPTYQLTADVEMVLAFVHKATRAQPFIGTQSRLRAILSLLDNVASELSDDPQDRIEKLQRQRAEIDRELERLMTGSPSVSPKASEVREQFSLAALQLEQLKSEFRAVEDQFQAITRSVQQRILNSDESRGLILDFALDSEELLKQGDEGQSFFEFLKLLHSPESQDRVAQLVRQLSKIEWISSRQEDLDSVRSMVPTLLSEAEKILRTTQHLSTALRRLLDSRSMRQHQQLAHLLRDIRSLAASLAEKPPTHVGLEVEAELEIRSAMDRPFWTQAEPFTEVDLRLPAIDPMDKALTLEELVSLDRIDWQTMRRNVTVMTHNRGETSIAELLERYPIRSGSVELLGYIQIAHDDGHVIDRSQFVELLALWEGPFGRTLRLPRIVFLPEAARRNRRHRTSTVAESEP